MNSAETLGCGGRAKLKVNFEKVYRLPEKYNLLNYRN